MLKRVALVTLVMLAVSVGLIIILELAFMARSGTIYIDPFDYGYSEIVDVTVYSATELQTDSKPLVTASGFVIDTCELPKLVSVSRDLLDCFPYGTVIKITHPPINQLYGEYFVVLDCMNSRFEKRIDILIPNRKRLNKWENVHIIKL